MRDQAARTTLALLACATLGVAGCSSGSGKGKEEDKSTPIVRDTGAQDGAALPTVNMPDLTGKDLAAATAAVKAAGFTGEVAYRDALGQNRKPAADKTWKVCTQMPAPGPSNPQEKVDLAAVPGKETCSGAPTSVPPVKTADPTRITIPPTKGQTSNPPNPTATRPDPRPTGRPTFVFYRNCRDVKAAGAAPIRRGDPGYGLHLDRDGDGIACER
ncbi:excalibur calcium-binding domain-containing protein [Yinghuangia sp. YIM S09857]|uniref:excalibur calcium-binding domain-containing protein n=1 Tax=Yinghuangia sp. YIM S09857 TaxID=3436929 RepID=UPI003F539B95